MLTTNSQGCKVIKHTIRTWAARPENKKYGWYWLKTRNIEKARKKPTPDILLIERTNQKEIIKTIMPKIEATNAKPMMLRKTYLKNKANPLEMAIAIETNQIAKVAHIITKMQAAKQIPEQIHHSKGNWKDINKEYDIEELKHEEEAHIIGFENEDIAQEIAKELQQDYKETIKQIKVKEGKKIKYTC